METEPDEQGIKTITSYRRNDKGQVEKVVRRVKIVTQYRRVQQAVLERRERMAKFGAAASTVNTENVTYPSYEEIKIEKPGAEAPDQLQKLAASASSAVVCRRCGGAHWTLSCPLKDVRGIGEGGPSASSAADAAASGGLQAGGSGKYVNPRARAAATGGASAGAGPEISEEELTQLRVLNLMDDVEDDSLRNLFAAYGHIEKLFIARDKVTGRSRGFAFVRYTRHDQALRAKEALGEYYTAAADTADTAAASICLHIAHLLVLTCNCRWLPLRAHDSACGVELA